jgi:hypothetical protein
MSTATTRPTAPLPQPAADALARLESAFRPVDLTALAADYRSAAAHAAELAQLAASGRMSDLDADSLAHAEDLASGARAALASAGRLDLIGGA